jgi:hypothetical protein
MNAVPTALDVAAHTTGVLSVLAGAVGFLTSPAVVARFTVAAHARGYEEATFHVDKVVHYVPSPREDSSEDYHLEGRIGGRPENYAPASWSGHAVGQELPVRYNPTMPFRDLRVLAPAPGFVAGAWARALRLAGIVHGPLLVLIATHVFLMKMRQARTGVTARWDYVRLALVAAGFGLGGAAALRFLLTV